MVLPPESMLAFISELISGICLSPCRPEAFPVVKKQVKQRKGGITVCYHLDIYRSITNDRIENLRKEANGNRRMNDNEVIDWWISTNMLFILFFRSGKG